MGFYLLRKDIQCDHCPTSVEKPNFGLTLYQKNISLLLLTIMWMEYFLQFCPVHLLTKDIPNLIEFSPLREPNWGFCQGWERDVNVGTLQNHKMLQSVSYGGDMIRMPSFYSSILYYTLQSTFKEDGRISRLNP